MIVLISGKIDYQNDGHQNRELGNGTNSTKKLHIVNH